MKFFVRLHEACLVTWLYDVDAESEEHAKRKVRKGQAGDPISADRLEPLAGYPTMLEIVHTDDDETKH